MAKDLKAGDIVHIYLRETFTGKDRDEVGVITGIFGHKTDVLVDGKIESWDLSDLKKMASWKKHMTLTPTVQK